MFSSNADIHVMSCQLGRSVLDRNVVIKLGLPNGLGQRLIAVIIWMNAIPSRSDMVRTRVSKMLGKRRRNMR